MSEKSLVGIEPAVNSRPKLGIALSGGGFRASFFHIGVLAQMGVLGLLRHVEAISTVSGGSIIGALYYLHVKRLLETKTDVEITDEDYKAIVQRIEIDFLPAVQQNIRMRTFLNPLNNIRMVMGNYSRSDRIGELYDEYFYRPVVDPKRSNPIEMRELKIRPLGERDDFHPIKHNAGRKAKVPIVLINATTLNNGHNWRFEASSMGEPERKDHLKQEIDKNFRLLRPPSYEDIILKQQNMELGLAVAASACVPGIFHPLAISDLYPDDIRVQLVDGGVHDNQGVQGLLDTGCSLFIVSDASGQMKDESDPATGVLSVLSRSNGILMDRLREEELFGLLKPNDRPVALMHLRKGLAPVEVPWIDSDGLPASMIEKKGEQNSINDDFRVAYSVQDLLSRIRTDLDSFTDVEAFSLMLDGYRMSEPELRQSKDVGDLIRGEDTGTTQNWRFLEIAPWIQKPTPNYLRHLQVASRLVFKVFRLSWTVTAVTLLFIIGVIVGIGILFQNQIAALLSSSLTVRELLIAVLILSLGLVPHISRAFYIFRFLRSPSEFIVRFVTRAALPAFGSVFVAIHLAIFDRLFLWLGRLERLGANPNEESKK
jgi:NTE family protein